jgi:carbonic anhydrase/acetyltransferase-like protein (isoleucine patch superfamily)
MTIQTFGDKTPRIDPTAFISESATIIGDVEIGSGCSVWPNAVIRGDEQPIRIAENSNIQDNVVIHAPSSFEAPVKIGRNVSVGHCAMLHGCIIDDNSLIGIHAVILDKTWISSWVLIGAGAVVPGNMVIPSKSLVVGVPGKVVRQLNDDDLRYIEDNARTYVRLANAYRMSRV